MEQEWNKTDAFAEQMLQMDNDYTVPSAPELESTSQEPPSYQNSDLPIYDFGQLSAEEPVVEQPSTSLMGMMDSKGREHIEFPANSGKLWYRDEPDSPWIKNWCFVFSYATLQHPSVWECDDGVQVATRTLR